MTQIVIVLCRFGPFPTSYLYAQCCKILPRLRQHKIFFQRHFLWYIILFNHIHSCEWAAALIPLPEYTPEQQLYQHPHSHYLFYNYIIFSSHFTSSIIPFFLLQKFHLWNFIFEISSFFQLLIFRIVINLRFFPSGNNPDYWSMEEKKGLRHLIR